MTEDYDRALITAFWAWLCDRIDRQPIGAKEVHLYVDDFLAAMRSGSPAYAAIHDAAPPSRKSDGT